MKRKVSLLTIVGVLICLIAGIGIYVNVMKRDSKNGMCLETKDITSTGMTLCLDWENEGKGASLAIKDQYQIQKLTFLGWKQEYDRPKVLEAEKWEDSREYFQIWNLDWEWSIGKLSSGVYRVEKEVTVLQEDGAEDKVLLYAPFLCGNWWAVLLAGLVTISIVILVVVGKKSTISRKKKLIIGTCFAVIFLVIGGLLFLRFYERRFGWDDVGRSMILDEEEAEQMEFYIVSEIAWAEDDLEMEDEDAKEVELTSEQRKELIEAFDGFVSPVRRLWYQYDAVIVIDDEIEYAINTKERIAYVNYKDEFDEFFGYIELTREENQMIKDIIGAK